MRRVLLTVHKFFPEHRAGTEVLTLKVAQELQRRGAEVLVVTANPPDLDARHKEGPESYDYVFEGVDVHVVGEALRLKNYTFEHEYYHPEIKGHFLELLERFMPDLVHIFHAQNLSASIIEAANQRSVPVVCSTTDFWFVCPVVQLKRPNGALCRGPDASAFNCLTCYTPALMPPREQVKEAIERKYGLGGRLLRSLPGALSSSCASVLQGVYFANKWPKAVSATIKRPAALRAAANSARAIMVPTMLMHDIFIENGIREDILHHVPFGLDTSLLAGHESKSASAEIRFAFIGTIFEHKGLDLLIRAFQHLPAAVPARLTIYGDMKQFPDYARSIRDLALRDLPNREKIAFAGTFPNAELGSVLENIDVLVVPSRWYENTPLVIQSALATKTPLIATDLGGMSELIKHGENGLLFKLNDYRSLAQCLKQVIDQPELLHKFRSNIAPERTIAQMVDDIESIYERVLSSDRLSKGKASAEPIVPSVGDIIAN